MATKSISITPTSKTLAGGTNVYELMARHIWSSKTSGNPFLDGDGGLSESNASDKIPDFIFAQ